MGQLRCSWVVLQTMLCMLGSEHILGPGRQCPAPVPPIWVLQFSLHIHELPAGKER